MLRRHILYVILLSLFCSCSHSRQQGGNDTQKDSMVTIVDTFAVDTITPKQPQAQPQPLAATSSVSKPTKQKERYDSVDDAYDDGYVHGYQDGWDDGWHRVSYGLSFLVEPDYTGFGKHYEIGYTNGYADGYEEGEEEKDQ